MEGKHQHHSFYSLQNAPLAFTDGQANVPHGELVAKKTPIASSEQLGVSASQISLVDNLNDALPTNKQTQPKQDPQTAAPGLIHRTSFAESITSRRSARSLLPRRSSSLNEFKTDTRSIRSSRSIFARDQDPRLPAFLGRHSSTKDRRLASPILPRPLIPRPLLPKPLRSRTNSHLETLHQNHDPNIFIGTSAEVGDATFRKYPVLTPRFINQTTRIMMTSSEISVAGSYADTAVPQLLSAEHAQSNTQSPDQATIKNIGAATQAKIGSTAQPLSPLSTNTAGAANSSYQQGYVSHPQMDSTGAALCDEIAQEAVSGHQPGSRVHEPRPSVLTTCSAATSGEEFPQRPLSKPQKVAKKMRGVCYRITGC